MDICNFFTPFGISFAWTPCETLNLLITEKILKSMDDKELVAIVLLDLSKAFDSIDHALLLEKLKMLNVPDEAICWFKSY